MDHSPNPHYRLRLVLSLACLYMAWGTTYLAIRYAVATIPPFFMGGMRFIVAGGGTLGWFAWRKPALIPRALKTWASAAVTGALLMAGGNGLVCLAETRVSSGMTALFVASMPFWVVLLDWVRPKGRVPTRFTLAGLAIGFAGMLWLVEPWNPDTFGEGKIFDLPGLLALLVSNLCWATGSLASKDLPLPKSSFLTTGMQMFLGGVFMIGIGWVIGEGRSFSIEQVSRESILGWCYLIVFGSLIGYTAYAWLLKNTTPAQATTYSFVNPVVALAVGAWVAGEPVSARVFLAAAVILVAVAIILTQRFSPLKIKS